jgi:hypothetical protein
MANPTSIGVFARHAHGVGARARARSAFAHRRRRVTERNTNDVSNTRDHCARASDLRSCASRTPGAPAIWPETERWLQETRRSSSTCWQRIPASLTAARCAPSNGARRTGCTATGRPRKCSSPRSTASVSKLTGPTRMPYSNWATPGIGAVAQVRPASLEFSQTDQSSTATHQLKAGETRPRAAHDRRQSQSSKPRRACCSKIN